eukprot:scaffold105669_cov36-Phaeocystis_antarctica.AAC.1
MRWGTLGCGLGAWGCSLRDVGLQPGCVGLQPGCVGLQPGCAGLQPGCAGLQSRLEGSRLEPAVTKHEADPRLAAYAARHVDGVLALPHAAARRACRVGSRLEQRRYDVGARLRGETAAQQWRGDTQRGMGGEAWSLRAPRRQTHVFRLQPMLVFRLQPHVSRLQPMCGGALCAAKPMGSMPVVSAALTCAPPSSSRRIACDT